MKFRWKMTLCMICLLSILFGIGGSAFISISFQASLEREQKSAMDSCQILLKSLQVRDKTNLWIDENGVTDVIRQMTGRGTFSAVRLASGNRELFTQGTAAADFRDLSHKTDSSHLAVAYFKDTHGTPYLQIASSFQLAGKTLYLNLGDNLSALYAARALQQQVYRWIYIAILLLCAVLAWIAAWLMTRPLSSLSKASKEIASGNLSYRSGIYSDDEIGALSKDFDTMAQQVENSIQSLKDSALRQEQFMGNFAHELKTPMTSIIGYADLLRGQTLTPEEQTDSANYIFSEGKRLESLSFKLLDIFVSDRKNLSLKSVSPAEIASDIAEHLRSAYEKDSVTLSCDCEDGLCLLEPDLTRTLLLNLLENAKKAIEGAGWVRITGTMLPDGCRFTISDNGRGISEEALQHLTEAFYRVDKARSRSQGNAGLGLTLCAKIAELHHGNINFSSKPGSGTTVTVDLKGGRP